MKIRIEIKTSLDEMLETATFEVTTSRIASTLRNTETFYKPADVSSYIRGVKAAARLSYATVEIDFIK